MFSTRRKRAVVCRYLSFYDPRLKQTFRLPLVHIRIKHGDVTFRTDALVDSGATATFLPLELTEVLNIELPQETQDTFGAGGIFSTYPVEIELIEVLKAKRPFCEFRNITVLIPTRAGALPHAVLGRDNIFRKYDITFREHKQHVVFKRPKG